ncbi:50S ribosomal protein L35 [Musa troglodytarum]|uniref:50S ribosomal protein L35 n=1 Tax=Musa troglodytarum TaxID=320322 RepID=A0A9E7F9K0_9LILI|nr:50S ribosomal protein L35 [Musa troglodytarum]
MPFVKMLNPTMKNKKKSVIRKRSRAEQRQHTDNMASSSLCVVRSSPLYPPPLRFSNGVRRSPSPMALSLKNKLSSSTVMSGSPLPRRRDPFPIPSSPSSQKPSALTVFAAKGYKIKTHKHPVNKNDYDYVIGASPYLKVNRHAT